MTAPGMAVTPLPRGRASRHVVIRHGARGAAAAPRLVPTDAPWQRRHLVRLGIWMGIGLAGIAVSWYRISGEGDWHDQMPWLVVGVVALAVSGLGTAGWLMAASRAVHLEAHDVMQELRRQQVVCASPATVGAALVTTPAATVTPTPAPAIEREVDFVSGPTMTKVHRPTCALAAGKAVVAVPEDEIAARGLQRCGVCCG